jgi:hypothetical protein
MNKERNMKPMTKEEEYRNADVPMPKDEEDDYNGGKAYYKFLEFFFKNKRDEDDKK